MANAVAVLVYETAIPISFTVADALAVEKGDVLRLATPDTAEMSSANNDLFCGIAAEEKIANDGKTKIAVYRAGVFRVESGTTGCTVGKTATIEAKNEFTDGAATDYENGIVFGRFLETGTDGQFVLMELGA